MDKLEAATDTTESYLCWIGRDPADTPVLATAGLTVSRSW